MLKIKYFSKDIQKIEKIEKGDWKRILFVPTGALLSTVSFNEGQTVPGIAHAVVIEHC